jgi:magnesium-protoporphyrin O-methyltransferase
MNINDKAIVKEYFNSTGFERWRKIYGQDEVSKVQKDIRIGHQQTIDTVLDWLKSDGDLAKLTICDAGCGVGSLALPLAQSGAKVYASDISSKMVEEAKARSSTLTQVQRDKLNLSVQDLEQLSGQYHTVICLDVLIHYSDKDIAKMISHLAGLAQSRLIISFAPKTFYLTMLKKVGELFPGPSKTTRAYQHPEQTIREILIDNGFAINRTGMTSTNFYYSRILEAVRHS